LLWLPVPRPNPAGPVKRKPPNVRPGRLKARAADGAGGAPCERLVTGDDLREPIQRLDQVSARIARLLADLAAPKPVPAADERDQPAAGRERRLQMD
jgi:hypothetical protein